MISLLKTFLVILLLNTATSENIIFKEDFESTLTEGWSWLREDQKAWRIEDNELEILVGPGNMWGGENSANNVLLRPLPKIERGSLSIRATVENKPTNQYEQIDLVCYYDDSNMVKIGLELVDGQLSIVMGREENDKTRTITIIPMESTKVQLQLTIKDKNIKGEFRTSETADWRLAGVCDLPIKGEAKASLQAYQGAVNVEHWAKVSNFLILKTED